MDLRFAAIGDSGTSGGRRQRRARDRGEPASPRWPERLDLPGQVLRVEMLAAPSQRASDVLRSQMPALCDRGSVALVAGTIGGVDVGWLNVLLRHWRPLRALGIPTVGDEELRRRASLLLDVAVVAWASVRRAVPDASIFSVGYPPSIRLPRDRWLFSQASVAGLGTAQRLLDETMSEAARLAGVHYISLADCGDEEHTYGWYWGLVPRVTVGPPYGPSFHLTPKGHQEVARLVAGAITDLIEGGAPLTRFGLPRNPEPTEARRGP